MTDLLQRFATLGKAIKDAGVSAKEMADAFSYFGRGMEKEQNLYPTSCPNCMRPTSWIPEDDGLVMCRECRWRYDRWALRNNDFAELRAQVLEFRLRDLELQRDRAERENQLRNDFERNKSHTETNLPTRRRTPAEMSLRDRIARAQELTRKSGSLTPEELDELTEIARYASNEHPRSTGRSGSFRRPQFPSIAPLRGQGVVGDEILMGNEEMLMPFETTDHITVGTSSNADGIESIEEMTEEDVRRAVEHMERSTQEAIERIYETEYGRYYYMDPGSNNKQPEPEEPKIKPKKPLKRKLDI